MKLLPCCEVGAPLSQGGGGRHRRGVVARQPLPHYVRDLHSLQTARHVPHRPLPRSDRVEERRILVVEAVVQGGRRAELEARIGAA